MSAEKWRDERKYNKAKNEYDLIRQELEGIERELVQREKDLRTNNSVELRQSLDRLQKRKDDAQKRLATAKEAFEKTDKGAPYFDSVSASDIFVEMTGIRRTSGDEQMDIRAFLAPLSEIPNEAICPPAICILAAQGCDGKLVAILDANRSLVSELNTLNKKKYQNAVSALTNLRNSVNSTPYHTTIPALEKFMSAIQWKLMGLEIQDNAMEVRTFEVLYREVKKIHVALQKISGSNRADIAKIEYEEPRACLSEETKFKALPPPVAAEPSAPSKDIPMEKVVDPAPADSKGEASTASGAPASSDEPPDYGVAHLYELTASGGPVVGQATPVQTPPTAPTGPSALFSSAPAEVSAKGSDAADPAEGKRKGETPAC